MEDQSMLLSLGFMNLVLLMTIVSQIPQSLTPWPMDGLRRVSINCFGFGGE